ncbi:MAG: amino acid permease [Hyphomicrobiales bacterium]|nr:amino acid permease [Hyphomicrobiales bacterium]MCP5370785.1 amino acid permease [Hyphomicrobiales bacterium]
MTAAPGPAPLKRSLGLVGLTLYGLGTIIGAGIYVLAGEVVATAGAAAPLSFLAAGVLAALTALSYAELSARHPEAAGAAAYVRQAFGSDTLARLTAAGVAVVALVAAASIARGGVAYLAPYTGLPAPVVAGAIVVLFTAIACLGVVESVFVAAVMSLVEVGGLVLVVAVGAPGLDAAPQVARAAVPADTAAWLALGGGAFLAFFAFAGFENLAVMAEETRDVGRTLPRAILLSILVATVLYVAVMVTALANVPAATLAGAEAPLLRVFAARGWQDAHLFSAVAVIATVNGVLIEILVLARLIYGLARRGLLPAVLGAVHPGRRTPILATLIAGAAVLAMATTLPFQALARLSSLLLLLVFTAVNLSLWRLHRRAPDAAVPIRAPRWVPPLGAASCLALVAAEVLG